MNLEMVGRQSLPVRLADPLGAPLEHGSQHPELQREESVLCHEFGHTVLIVETQGYL